MTAARAPRPPGAPDALAPLLRAPALARVPGVAHGFATRAGGVSPPPYGPLNLGRRPGERDDDLLENWARAARGLHPDLGAADVALVSQVHGARVLVVTGPPPGPLAPLGEADALVTARAGVVLAARAADCAPVLLAGRAAIAAVHAGWRGVAAGVVAAAVAALVDLGEAPRDLVAAVGPCATGARYEVGPEVLAALARAGVPPSACVRARGPGDRAWLDLDRAVAHQLAAVGVGTVERLGRCTITDPELHSHRRDGDRAGRGAGLIARLAP